MKSTHQVNIKNVFSYWKNFLLYFTQRDCNRNYTVEVMQGSPQNDHLNFSFVEDITVVVERNGYSMVPNNSAARLLISKIFSLPTRLIWTYRLIKIQIIFLSTRLLSTILYFFYIFSMLFAAFFATNASIMHFFHVCSSFY